MYEHNGEASINLMSRPFEGYSWSPSAPFIGELVLQELIQSLSNPASHRAQPAMLCAWAASFLFSPALEITQTSRTKQTAKATPGVWPACSPALKRHPQLPGSGQPVFSLFCFFFPPPAVPFIGSSSAICPPQKKSPLLSWANSKGQHSTCRSLSAPSQDPIPWCLGNKKSKWT